LFGCASRDFPRECISDREIVARLCRLGFEFGRQAAGSHEIWAHPLTGKFTTIPNQPGDMAILRRAGIDPERFLER